MAGKKEHKIVSASTGEDITGRVEETVKKAGAAKEDIQEEGRKKQTALRIWAVVFWILAFGFEVLTIMIYSNKLPITKVSTSTAVIISLVADLIFVIIGAQFWKAANHADPISEKNRVKFWFYNNMGVIICCFAFVPFLIVTLVNKNADPKLKKIATIAALCALLIGGLLGYDWNPVSVEGLSQASQTLQGETVYWTPYGTKYHTHEDCGYLNHSDTLTAGTIDQAIEAGRSTICSGCASKDNLVVGENGAVTSAVTDAVTDAVTNALEEVAPAA